MCAVERQQEFWASRFRDAGWQTERFIDGMWTSRFFFSQEVAPGAHRHLVQGLRGPHRRRRALRLPYCGMGISCGLAGACVLVGEINRYPNDLPTALANYDTTVSPPVQPRALERLDCSS